MGIKTPPRLVSLDISTFFNDKTYPGINEGQFSNVLQKCLSNGLYHRWSKYSDRNYEANMESLIQEAYLMMVAASKGFGPSIYALYIEMMSGTLENGMILQWPSLHVLMDAGQRTLHEYIDDLQLKKLEELIVKLTSTCETVSRAGFLLFDIKPSNILCGKNADGSLNIMMIDFDPLFTFDVTDEKHIDCVAFINLFLLALHIECKWGHNRSTAKRPDGSAYDPAKYNLMIALIRTINSKQTSSSELCQIIEHLIPRIQKKRKRSSELDNNIRDASYFNADIPNESLRMMVLRFIRVVQHYFENECNRRFNIDDSGATLIEQLMTWLTAHYEEELGYVPKPLPILPKKIDE